jgi:2-dehydropantoate 2-reductase
MRIAVIGAGGAGGYFGGRLAAAGADVQFVARGAHAAAIREHGLRIESAGGDFAVPVTVHETPGAIGTADVILIAVKLWDTDALLPQLRPLLGPQTMVISLQNGVAKDELLRDALGFEHVAGGLCYIAVVIDRPGVIKHTGTMQRLVVGEYGGAETPRLRAFVDACRDAGIAVEISPDIERALWEKFVFINGLSGATCAVRQPIGPIRKDAHARELLRQLFAETVAVGRARGVGLDPAFAEERLAFCDGLPPVMRASMAEDLERGNRIEMPWFQGFVVTAGRSAGVATPANAFVEAVLSPYTAGTPKTP